MLWGMSGFTICRNVSVVAEALARFDLDRALRLIESNTEESYRARYLSRIAMAVASGRADIGLGILASARALDLDFIPISRERYDLVVPEGFLNDKRMEILLEIIRSPKFIDQVGALGGLVKDQ